MAEPDDQTEENVAETEAAEDTATETEYADTKDTDLSESEIAETKSTSSKEKENDGQKEKKSKPVTRKKKPRFSMKNCLQERWTCRDMPLWRIYMNAYIDDQKELEKEDRLKRRKPADLPKFPCLKSSEEICCDLKDLPLNAFNSKNLAKLPDKLNRHEMIRIWKNMRANLPVNESQSKMLENALVLKTPSDKWPGVWPCTTRDLVAELRKQQRRNRTKRKDMFPCDPEDGEPTLDDTMDFADRKELGHARVPPICPDPKKNLLVDRAAGEHPGLVDGDYVILELSSKEKGSRVYANVPLRGLKGMHLPELGPSRERQKTWKFCFYQAIVALLAKTQLRYKYAWSVNIDYIYDHAWMLFTHIGTINVKEKQRLDDVVVYNYKYSVELELVYELKDIPIVTGVSCEYEEKNFKRKVMLDRKELMHVKLEVGSEKITDQQTDAVHEDIKRVEDWFDKLPLRYRNCIFRTSRFSLAFWSDNSFWYLYNPYRCDEFGDWHDEGYACILKFCTKKSLKRHLMILLLRAHAYAPPRLMEESSESKISVPAEENDDAEDAEQQNGGDEVPGKTTYVLQIFNMIYHCCQIHNLRLLERRGPKPPKRRVRMKILDDCPFDPLDFRDPCMIEQDEGDLKDAVEKPTWLKLEKISWAKCTPSTERKRVTKDVGDLGKLRWHQYVVEEPNKLFSLWGEIHITNNMFEKENHGMQTYACYVVCAGMSRIMAPEYWSAKTLDVIVMCGDRYYTHSKMEGAFKATKDVYSHVSCWNRYLMSHFTIGETMFEANVLPAICGRLYAKSSKSLWQTLEQMFLRYQFGILTCENACLGLFKFCGAYYMCDVNSFGPPLFPYGEGAAYLMRATYFYKFMTLIILTIGSPECSQFTLNPIEILKAIDVGPTSLPTERNERKKGRKSFAKTECPFDDEKKKQMKKWKHKAESSRTIDNTCCKNND